MSAIRLYVTATGMVSPVGLSAASACAAMRAGLSAFGRLPYWDNTRKPITGSPVPVLPLDLGRHERLVDLLAMALADATGGDVCWLRWPNRDAPAEERLWRTCWCQRWSAGSRGDFTPVYRAC
jgi:hypothetical protein